MIRIEMRKVFKIKTERTTKENKDRRAKNRQEIATMA
jgi:hypothetical protein